MLDIEKMINTNDFSDLLNSSQQERDLHGGNHSIFFKLVDYLHFQYIQEVIKSTFKNDLCILKEMDKHLKKLEEIEKRRQLERLQQIESSNSLSGLLA